MAAGTETKLVFPGLAGLYQRFSPFSYAFMRFAAGAVLVPHGVQKIVNVPIAKFAPNIAAKGLPFPEALAYLTYFAESVAAASLAIGLFTRVAAAVIGVENVPVPVAVRLLLDRARL
jgi:putative oxidoreductase